MFTLESVPRSIHPRLSIDHSIREGIEELHFSNEPILDYQPVPVAKYVEPVQATQKIKENKTFIMTKDGIQMLKERLQADAEEYQNNQKQKSNQLYEPVKINLNENFTPVPTIAKVKLNKLNTSDFFANPPSSPSFSYLNAPNHNRNYHDDTIATSDL